MCAAGGSPKALSSRWLVPYLTGQVQAEDAVGVEEGLELGARRRAGVEGQIAQERERVHRVEVVEGGPERGRDVRRHRSGRQLGPAGHLTPPVSYRLGRVAQLAVGQVGWLVVRNRHQGEPGG